MYEYEGLRRQVYTDETGRIGNAVFIPVCPHCGRFVKASETIQVNEIMGLKDEPNAVCKKCGPIKMPFEGFFSFGDIPF